MKNIFMYMQKSSIFIHSVSDRVRRNERPAFFCILCCIYNVLEKELHGNRKKMMIAYCESRVSSLVLGHRQIFCSGNPIKFLEHIHFNGKLHLLPLFGKLRLN